VEDDPDNQEVAASLLMAAGQHVTIAPNGLAAVEAVRNGRYDLVLMDVQMPGMDGLEATRRIRQLAEGRKLPIVAMTANAFEEDRRRCVEAGMDDFLAKPVEAEDLYRVMLEWYPRAVA